MRCPTSRRSPPWPATPLAGAAALQLTATGAATQPELDLAVTGTDLRAANLALSRLTGAFAVAFTAPLGDGPVGLRAKGTAATEGLALDGRALADGRLELALDGELPARGRGGRPRAGLALVSGRGDRPRQHRSRPARRHRPARRPRTRAQGRDAGPGRRTCRWPARSRSAPTSRWARAPSGSRSRSTAAPPACPACRRARRNWSAPGRRCRPRRSSSRRARRVQSLVLTGAGVRLEGEPRYGLADRALGGELRLAMPDLARLQPLVGQPIAGAATLRAGLGGTVELPAITLDGGRPPRGRGPDVRPGDPHGRGEGPARRARRLGQRQCRARAAGGGAGHRLRARRRAAQAHRPDAERAGDAAGGRRRGGADGPLVRGQLAGEARDLAALEAWTGQKLAGSVELDLRLTTPQDRQDATLKLDASDLGGDFGSLRSASLAATLTDALGRGGIDGSLRAQGFAAPEIAVAEPRSPSAAGSPRSTSRRRPPATRPASRSTRRRRGAGRHGARKTIRVTQGHGQGGRRDHAPRAAGDHDARRRRPGRRPARRRARPGAAPGQAAARPDPGRRRAEPGRPAAGDPGAVRRAAAGRHGPGRLTLSGTRARPEVALDATVANAALDPAAKVKLDGKLTGTLRGGRLDADLSLSGLGSAPLTARASLPATFTLDPVLSRSRQRQPERQGRRPSRPREGGAVVALGGTQLAGTLQAALDLSGTLQQPALAGTLDLDGGSVQDVASGLILRKLALRARAAGDRLTIERLTAADPTGGTLRAGARCACSPAAGSATTSPSTPSGRACSTTRWAWSSSPGRSVRPATSPRHWRAAISRWTAPTSRSPTDWPLRPGDRGHGGQPGRRPARPTQRPAVAPFAVGFDITVDIPGRLFVRGRGLDSEWSGKLTLKGDLADPLVEGELDVRRGHFDLLDRRFTIDRGALDFVGSRPPIPMIDLATTARTAEVTVTLTLQGPAADPKIRSPASPPCPRTRSCRASCSAPRPRGSRRCRACGSPPPSRSCRAAAS